MATAWGLASPQWYTFGSMHGAVMQFAFMDGSVRGVPKSVNQTSFIYASGKDDRQPYSALMND